MSIGAEWQKWARKSKWVKAEESEASSLKVFKPTTGAGTEVVALLARGSRWLLNTVPVVHIPTASSSKLPEPLNFHGHEAYIIVELAGG